MGELCADTSPSSLILLWDLVQRQATFAPNEIARSSSLSR